MKQQLGIGLLCGVGVVLGMSSAQAQERFEAEPLWAYAWSTPPQPGDQPRAQIPPQPGPSPGRRPRGREHAETGRRQQRDVHAHRHPRRPQRHRLVPRRPSAHDRHHPTRSCEPHGRARPRPAARVTCLTARDGRRTPRRRDSRSNTRSSSSRTWQTDCDTAPTRGNRTHRR